MGWLDTLMPRFDDLTGRLLRAQIRDAGDPDLGGFFKEASYWTEPRESGFGLSRFVIAYVCRESRHFRSPEAAEGIRRAFAYLDAHLRPDGCVDLSYCNFDSAPDTAFMVNSLFNAWWLANVRADEETRWVMAPLTDLIVRCCEGVAAGGFHTPNHRWAIAACLKSAAKAAGRPDFSARADEYLAEGLDIDEDGEFAERSTGIYNRVNDDQMIRLYLATGERKYLEAARSNLRMMLAYIEPDDTLFTFNSTRQDHGSRVPASHYWIMYLLTGFLLGDRQLGGAAEWIRRRAEARGEPLDGAEWLLLLEGLDGWAADEPFDPACVTESRRFFPASRIARVRHGDLTWTVMGGRADFLHVRRGSLEVTAAIYANVCDRRNFAAASIEETDGGFRLTCRHENWYYRLYGDGPATSDWWAMDNEHTRERLRHTPLDFTVTVTDAADGVDLTVRTEGLDRVPFRLELGVTPGRVRGEQFLLDGKAGEHMILTGGRAEITAPDGSRLTVSPGFARHGVLSRSDRAWPESPDLFTIYMTDVTPVDRTVHFGTAPEFDRAL